MQKISWSWNKNTLQLEKYLGYILYVVPSTRLYVVVYRVEQKPNTNVLSGKFHKCGIFSRGYIGAYESFIIPF